MNSPHHTAAQGNVFFEILGCSGWELIESFDARRVEVKYSNELKKKTTHREMLIREHKHNIYLIVRRRRWLLEG
jgi:hypothetical protein